MRFTLFAAAAIAIAAPAHGQSAPSVSRLTPTADAIAEADALLTATGFEDQMAQTAVLTARQSMDTALAQAEERVGEAMPADLRAEIEAIVDESVSGTIAKLRVSARPQVARIYATYFTAAELRELRQLMTAPVMVKSQKVTPQLMSELMQVGLAAALPDQQALTDKIQAAVTRWTQRQNGRRSRS